ncbi:MAG TPA: hypothetical protein VFN44_22815 [Solirubrobacteraceae bacterium]|nr:hypothetical protein [Solirubrobacteraceae bacterium]
MRFLLPIYDDEPGSDDATRRAERIPVPASGGVEVRPVIDHAAFETAGEDVAAQA